MRASWPDGDTSTVEGFTLKEVEQELKWWFSDHDPAIEVRIVLVEDNSARVDVCRCGARVQRFGPRQEVCPNCVTGVVVG